MIRKKDLIAKTNHLQSEHDALQKRVAAMTASLSNIISASDGSISYQTNRLDYVLKHYDLTQNLAYLHFDGLPFNTTAFARHVYNNGWVIVVKDKNTKQIVYGKPVAVKWNFDNLPTHFQVVYQRNETNLNTSCSYGPGEYVLFYDAEPFANGTIPRSRNSLIQPILKQMDEILARLNINIVASGGKIVIQAPDAATHKAIKAELAKEFNSDSPFIVLDSQQFGKEVTLQQPEIRFNELFQAFKQYDEMRLLLHGLGGANVGNTKGERLVVAETESMNDSVTYMAYMRKLNIQKFINDMFTVFKIQLEWRCI